MRPGAIFNLDPGSQSKCFIKQDFSNGIISLEKQALKISSS